MDFALLPPVHKPPHDPTWTTLDARNDWRAALLDRVSANRSDGTLRLAAASGGRSLTEAGGSFGGLVPPANVAVGADGSVFLLDQASATLRKFDACECRFLTVPCLGGVGSGARQVNSPGGIASSRGNLFIADTGNRRLAVYALRGYVLRGFWQPPAAELPVEWSPVAVAADSRGRIFVADPANGSVHRFSRHGVWETRIANLGALTHLAVDCCDRLYVQQAATPQVTVFNRAGQVLGTVDSVDAIAGRFGRLPFRVDANGALDFAERCAYDQHGDQLTSGAAADVLKFESSGTFLSDALDSRIYRCVWHRIVLSGCVPSGNSITVRSYTSEIAQPLDVILGLPDEAWSPAQTAVAVDGQWDTLLRSAPGRFLWLRLELLGGTRGSPCIERIRIEFPRISLRRYLPAVFAEDPAGSDFIDRFLAIFDTTFRSIEQHIDEQAALFDPDSAPATAATGATPDFLSWIASWIGINVDRSSPVAERRRFIRESARLYDLRGTRNGLWKLLTLFLGMTPRSGSPASSIRHCAPIRSNCDPPPTCTAWEPPPLVLEHFQLRRWLFVGAGRLGDQAALWGQRIVNRSQLDVAARADCSQLISSQDPYRDPFHVYASKFTVFVPACIQESPRRKKGLENLLAAESPAHTQWHIEYVAPRFRIGVQSMVGYDAVVGRYPKEAVTLGTTMLNHTTVLSEGDDGRGADGRARPGLRIGVRAQVGASTRLE